MSSVSASRTMPPVRASKLRVPTVTHWVVARPRLSAVQMAAERSRVVLVSAPAGYGKSTLVAQWSDLDPRTSGWVQLGPGDNDSVVLLAHVVAALERTGPVCDELLEELQDGRPGSMRSSFLSSRPTSASATHSFWCWTMCTS